MKKYLFTMTLLSAILFAVYYLFDNGIFGYNFHDRYPVLVIFFFLQSIPIAWLLSLAQKNQADSPMYVMASIGLRMITALILLLVFYALKIEEINTLSIQFATVYLLFLVFELSTVLANLRRN